MKSKILIIVFVFSAIFPLTGYYCLFKYQMGRSVTAEWWVVNVESKKEQIAKNINGNRLLFLSGSNGLFGLNSKIISDITGKNAINLSIHAGLDISYYRMLLERNIQEGDVVILPLEYEHYFRNDAYSKWFVNNMLAWGESYFTWLPFNKKMEFVSHVSALRVLEGVLAGVQPMVDSLSNVHAYKGNSSNVNYGYNYLTLTPTGDMNIHTSGETYADKFLKDIDKVSSEISYSKHEKNITAYALSELQKIKLVVEKNHGKLYLTWPVTMKTKFFNEADPESVTFAKNLRIQLNKNGFATICDDFYANISSDLFFDSRYHPSSIGADLRSTLLSQCIKKYHI